MSFYRIIFNFKPGGPGLSGPTQFISATQVFYAEFEGTRDELCMKILKTMRDGGFYWIEEKRVCMVPSQSIACVDVKEIRGPGCWLKFCLLCLKEREEIRKVEARYDQLRKERAKRLMNG